MIEGLKIKAQKICVFDSGTSLERTRMLFESLLPKQISLIIMRYDTYLMKRYNTNEK